MFEPNDCCELPPDDSVIWRYFDFAKFVSLLTRRELFFPSASNLEDPFEGSLPLAGRPRGDEWNPTEEESHLCRDLVMISSWHLNNDESFAMWKLYSKSIEAVAIRSTVKRLKESFRDAKEYPVFISKVGYIDYRRDRMPGTEHLARYLSKSKPYAYENEVRAIVDLYGKATLEEKGRHELNKSGKAILPNIKDKRLVTKALDDSGVYVPVDLDTLIEKIYISPSAGRWFLELVEDLMKRLDLQFDITHSVLAESPRYSA